MYDVLETITVASFKQFEVLILITSPTIVFSMLQISLGWIYIPGIIQHRCLCLWFPFTLFRYGLHLWELNYEGVWENRAIYVYYTELGFELVVIAVDFIHHLHMLVSEAHISSFPYKKCNILLRIFAMNG